MKYKSHEQNNENECTMIYCNNEGHEMKVHNITYADVNTFRSSNDDKVKNEILERSGQKYPTLRNC